MSFKSIWTLKLGHHPAGGCLLANKCFWGQQPEGGRNLVLNHWCCCVSLQWWRKGLWAFLQGQRRKEKLALMKPGLCPWKELQGWAMTDLTSRESPLGPQGLRDKEQSRIWGAARGLRVTSPALSPAPRMHICPSLISDSPAQALCFSSSAPGPESSTLRSHSLDPGYSRFHLNTLSERSCSYLVVGHALRLRYQLCTAHLAVTVCK